MVQGNIQIGYLLANISTIIFQHFNFLLSKFDSRLWIEGFFLQNLIVNREAILDRFLFLHVHVQESNVQFDFVLKMEIYVEPFQVNYSSPLILFRVILLTGYFSTALFRTSIALSISFRTCNKFKFSTQVFI